MHNYSPNIYCYINKQFTIHKNQLLDYKYIRNSHIHPYRTNNNHVLYKYNLNFEYIIYYLTIHINTKYSKE